MSGLGTKGANKHLRVFAHYVLGRLILLFFFCHPGTLATFSDGQAYLLNRYPNRDLITTEAQMADQRRHVTPRSPDDFAMRTGVPEEFLHGDASDNWTPDWAPSLEERFHSTVKAWLRRGSAVAKQAQDSATAAAAEAAPGMAFVPSPVARGAMDIRQARANDRQKERWMSLAELGAKHPRAAASRIPAFARRHGGHHSQSGHRGGSCPHGMQMLLGFRSRGGFPSRRRFPGFISNNSDASSNNVDVSGQGNNDSGNDVNSINKNAEQAAVAGILENPELSNASNYETSVSFSSLDEEDDGKNSGIFSSLMGGAADAYDSAVSFVGCALVTSPLGKRYLNAYDGHNTVPASAIRSGRGPAAMGGSTYDLVGFSNIDPFEASTRRGGGSSSRLLQ